MTFEEFFKKKKINLLPLEQAEPALFAEFKVHYEQMGEKSFDHTKKYWFNKLRLRFPAPVETKTEKVKIENQLAEQTITEMLAEPGTAPKPAFKPRFKAPVPTTITENIAPNETSNPTATEQTPPPAETIAPKAGFKPRFKASAPPTIVNPDSEEETPAASSVAKQTPSPSESKTTSQRTAT